MVQATFGILYIVSCSTFTRVKRYAVIIPSRFYRQCYREQWSAYLHKQFAVGFFLIAKKDLLWAKMSDKSIPGQNYKRPWTRPIITSRVVPLPLPTCFNPGALKQQTLRPCLWAHSISIETIIETLKWRGRKFNALSNHILKLQSKLYVTFVQPEGFYLQ